MTLSLSSLNLRPVPARCPDGTPHDISKAALAIAMTRGGGTAGCLKCNQVVELRKV